MIREISLPLVRRQRGLVSYFFGKPMESNLDEFVVITIWKNISSIKKFVGKD